MELSCEAAIPVKGDSGFQGLQVGQAVVTTPFKRKPTKKGEPKSELTTEIKEHNRTLSTEQISIEQSNAGFKRNQSVTQIPSNTRHVMSDSLAIVAIGMHNLRESVRANYPV